MSSPPTITFTRRILVERDAPLSSSPIRGVEGGSCLSIQGEENRDAVRAHAATMFSLACLRCCSSCLYDRSMTPHPRREASRMDGVFPIHTRNTGAPQLSRTKEYGPRGALGGHYPPLLLSTGHTVGRASSSFSSYRALAIGGGESKERRGGEGDGAVKRTELK